MSFDLTIVLTGLVGLVENTSSSRARMCALLVNGQPARKSGLDDSYLRRHRAFVKFPIPLVSSLSDQLENQPMNDSLGLWYLDGERVFLEIAEDSENAQVVGGANDFSIKRTLPTPNHPRTPKDAPKGTEDSFTWTLDSQRIFSSFQVDPRLFSPAPDTKRLAAQVFFDRGKVSTMSTTDEIWRVDQTLSDMPYEQVFAHELVVRYTGLIAARLTAINFKDPKRRRTVLDLTGLQRGGKLLIRIDNTCDDNPLEWPRDEEAVDDQDSKWIFELMSPGLTKAVRALLHQQNASLPIPRPIGKWRPPGPGSLGSGNCIPHYLAATAFSCPELDAYAAQSAASPAILPLAAEEAPNGDSSQ